MESLRRSLCLLVFLLGLPLILHGQTSIDLSGQWIVSLENRNDPSFDHLDAVMEGRIGLPGSLAEYQLGYITEGSDYGILTPEYKYIGKASYSREITIPASWRKKNITLLLERVLWQSRVFIDGNEISRQDALGSAHHHELGKLEPGTHTIRIIVNNDMIHNIGDKGHAYGEYTQSIWNGIVGRIELQAFDNVRILSGKTFPDIRTGELKLDLSIASDKKYKGRISCRIISATSGETAMEWDFSEKIKAGNNHISTVIHVGDKLEKWSEFNPETYILQTSIEAGKQTGSFETEFGYFTLGHNGTKILVNDMPVFLRGNLDCVHFPLTGYPSCNVADWLRIFKIYKEYGLNHARFHSWCPPEAAFVAANRVGIYLQAEASIWIDWWMSEDMNLKGRPEMDTKGHPQGLGYDSKRDSFVVAEMNRVVDVYGNHPSFTLFCIGNELGNSDFSVMEQWVADLKEKDPRRLYSVSTARTITNTDDFSATHYIKDVGRTRGLNGARTNWDFEETYSQMKIPIIAHEIGQWPVYPRWEEIEKYNGVLKARNFEGFKALARQNGVADQDHDFALASGALNQIMYKNEIESFLRTESCAGIQLLSMQDYQGQGEALIGWLDAHWDSKGITTPSLFREHCNTTVPLLRFEKYVWTNKEVFEASAQVSHHGASALSAEGHWEIRDLSGEKLAEGRFLNQDFKQGTLTNIGTINFPLADIQQAEKLNITIELSGTEFQNNWDIWVYPEKDELVLPPGYKMTTLLDEGAVKFIDAGGKLLLQANELGDQETSVWANFYPLYWSSSFFPGQGKTNIGLLIQAGHPAFADFPTTFHSNWQWESISKDARGFILNDLPEQYKPLAQPVDDFHRNNKVGSIFEFKLGRGSLLVCGYNLESELPAARQLKRSLFKYMQSEDFKPKEEVDIEYLLQLFNSKQKE